MIAKIKQAIETALETAAPNIKIYESAEGKGVYKQLPQAIIVVLEEQSDKNGTVVAKSVAEGVRTNLRKLYNRIIPVEVSISARDVGGVEAIYKGLLSALFGGLHDSDGNHIRLDRIRAIHIDEEDKLKKIHEIVATLEFAGGIYRSEAAGLIQAVEVELEA